MIKAVLLDLDNTLLHNPDAVFAAEFLRLADAFFSARIHYPTISKALLSATRAMIAVRSDLQLNSRLAAGILAEKTNLAPELIASTLQDFYREIYPQLQNCVEPVGNIGNELIDHLHNLKIAVVVATNPIYPAEAVRQRLQWANLPDDFSTYALVTHADNMHFAKPDPAYYVEIAARVGVEPDEVLIVGDSYDNDILPAQQVGVHTYHVESSAASSLSDLFQKIASEDWLETLFSAPLAPSGIEPELRGNLGAVFGTVIDVKPSFWRQHPDPNEWSPIQIVCHLLETEVPVQRQRLERIRAEDNPFLIGSPPPPGPRDMTLCDDDGLKVVQRFADTRMETIRWLETLQPDEWLRKARHSVFGPTSLLEMAHFTAQHDRLHINQLCQTLGRCQ